MKKSTTSRIFLLQTMRQAIQTLEADLQSPRPKIGREHALEPIRVLRFLGEEARKAVLVPLTSVTTPGEVKSKQVKTRPNIVVALAFDRLEAELLESLHFFLVTLGLFDDYEDDEPPGPSDEKVSVVDLYNLLLLAVFFLEEDLETRLRAETIETFYSGPDRKHFYSNR